MAIMSLSVKGIIRCALAVIKKTYISTAKVSYLSSLQAHYHIIVVLLSPLELLNKNSNLAIKSYCIQQFVYIPKHLKKFLMFYRGEGHNKLQ